MGYALPLKCEGNQWVSGPVFLRDDTFSGFSLVIRRWACACRRSIPWVAEKDYPWIYQQDPSQRLHPLPKEFPRQRFLAGVPNARSAGLRPAALPTAKQALEESGDGRENQGARSAALSGEPQRRPVGGESAHWIVRTAPLRGKPRDGRLHVFMPRSRRRKIISTSSLASKPP